MLFYFVISLLDNPVKPQIQPNPNRHVYQQHQRVIQIVHCDYRKGTERGRHDLNVYQGSTGREAHRQKLMMDVCLVRQEGVLPVPEAAKDDTDYIQAGDHQDAEGYQDGRVVCRLRMHTILYRKET